MNDPVIVGVLAAAFPDLRHEVAHVPFRYHSTCDFGSQICSVDVLHYQIVKIARLAEIVDGHNIRVFWLGESACLPSKTAVATPDCSIDRAERL